LNLDDGVSDHEISIDDLAERIKVQIDDGIEYQEPEVKRDGPSDEDREEAERISGEATDKIWFKIDTDNDGVIDENESKAFVGTLDADEARDWKEMFKDADAIDGTADNQIYYEDLEDIMFDRILEGKIHDKFLPEGCNCGEVCKCGEKEDDE